MTLLGDWAKEVLECGAKHGVYAPPEDSLNETATVQEADSLIALARKAKIEYGMGDSLPVLDVLEIAKKRPY